MTFYNPSVDRIREMCRPPMTGHACSKRDGLATSRASLNRLKSVAPERKQNRIDDYGLASAS